MPEVNHRDRRMFETEALLWAAHTQLREATQWSGAWAERMTKAVCEIGNIAREIRDYNDQFETADD